MPKYQDRAQELETLKGIVRAIMPRLPYHNFEHALDVAKAADRYATFEFVDSHDKHLLQLGALLHDVIYVIGAKDNEERSAEFARALLPAFNYDAEAVEKVAKIIEATKLPTKPTNKLEEIICDADLENLGREDFVEKNAAVAQELGQPLTIKWYQGSRAFLEGHKYYTKTAQLCGNPGIRRNLQRLYELEQNAPLSTLDIAASKMSVESD